MSEITTEIAGKLRLSIKKQLDSIGCKDLASDDDLLEYMMVISKWYTFISNFQLS